MKKPLFAALVLGLIAPPALAGEGPLPSGDTDAALRSQVSTEFDLNRDGESRIEKKKKSRTLLSTGPGGKFKLEISGLPCERAYVSGGFEQDDEVESRKGNDKVVRKRPGRTVYRMTVPGPGTTEDGLSAMRRDHVLGLETRHTLSLTLSNEKGTLTRLDFHDCYPTRWTIHRDIVTRSDRSAPTSEETVELSCGGDWKEFSPAEEQLKGAPRH